MKSIRPKLAALALAATASMSHAALLDFNSGVPLINDLGNYGFIDELVPYNGFTFEYPSLLPGAPGNYAWMWSRENAVFDGAQYYNSGTPNNGFLYHSLFNTNSTPSVTDSLGISNPTPFYFYGAKIDGYGGDPITYKLFNGVTFLGDFPVGPIPGSGVVAPGPQFMTNPYLGKVTKVVIIGAQGYYGLDDFTYDFTTPIPEPGTYALMLAGLVGVVAAARRKSKAKA